MHLLKSFRNFIADFAAISVARLPVLERSFIAIGRLCDPVPIVRTAYLRAISTYCTLLKQQKKQFRELSIENRTFRFDITDFTTISFFFRGLLFEPLTTRYVLESDLHGGTVLDVGANRGYLSILLALQTGEKGRVFSFEPNPKVQKELEHHIQLNELSDRVVISSLALSDKNDQRVTFYLSNVEANTGLSSLSPQPDLLISKALSQDNTIEVATMTLDRWIELNGIDTAIDLIKVDVEGAEIRVIEGAAKTLATNPPKRWIIETKINSNVRQMMSGFGYCTKTLDIADDSINLLCTRK